MKLVVIFVISKNIVERQQLVIVHNAFSESPPTNATEVDAGLEKI
jgi:hypothetical protein